MIECKHEHCLYLRMNKWCKRCGAILRYQPGIKSDWEKPAIISTGQQELEKERDKLRAQVETLENALRFSDTLGRSALRKRWSAWQ